VPEAGDENWWDGFAPPGADRRCYSAYVYGGELIIGGQFTYLGGVPAASVAAWNGASWRALGAGIEYSGSFGVVCDMTEHVGELIVVGDFDLAGGEPAPDVAAWDGESWRGFGTEEFTNAPVQSVVVWNDEVIVGGSFGWVGDRDCPLLARWSGTRWEPLVTSHEGHGVYALAVYDGDLIVSGAMESLDGAAVNYLARYDGASWEPLGGGLNAASAALFVWDGKLYVSGSMTEAGGVPVQHFAVWDGVSWAPAGDFSQNAPWVVASYLDDLVVGGSFPDTLPMGQFYGAYRRDGAQWTPLGGPFRALDGFYHVVHDLVEYEGDLIAAGDFGYAGNRFAAGLARWDGSTWQPFCGGHGVDQPCRAACVHDGSLVVGGFFDDAGCVDAEKVAMWDGSSWASLDGRFEEDSAFPLFVEGIASYRGDVVVVGNFHRINGIEVNNVARWDGEAWHDLAGGLAGFGASAHVHDDRLFVGGGFDEAGGIPAENLAAWDGTIWHSVGFENVAEGLVAALTTYEGDLVVAGLFRPRGDSDIWTVARWDGESWSPVGGEFRNSGAPLDLEVINGELYITGDFTAIDGRTVYGIARWDGAGWQPLGIGISYPGYALTSYNGDLVVVGNFSWAGEVYTPGIGRWDGERWSGFGSAFASPPHNYDVLPLGDDLYVLGEFWRVGLETNAAFNIARWTDPVVPVDLLSFAANRRGRDVVLRWQEGAARAAGGYQVYRGASEEVRRRIAELPPEPSGRYEYLDASAPAGEVSYWIREIGASGPADWYGPMTVEATALTLPPGSLRVHPNPTSGRSTIAFTLEAAAEVRIGIFDAAGRHLLDVLRGPLQAGPHAVFWDGRDAAGRAAGGGTYFARLEAGDERRQTKILIAR
jgi:hypothetical protein